MVVVLREFGFILPEFTPELFLQANKIVRMGVPPMRLEISTGISGLDFEEYFASRIGDALDGIQFNIIDVKTNKKAVGRLKYLADLENLP
jgi:hypothetical protein